MIKDKRIFNISVNLSLKSEEEKRRILFSVFDILTMSHGKEKTKQKIRKI